VGEAIPDPVGFAQAVAAVAAVVWLVWRL